MQYPPIGVRVLVPLGRKTITGVVYRPHEGALPDTVKLREVLDILDDIDRDEKIRSITISKDGESKVVFSNICDAQGIPKEIRCSNVIIEIGKEQVNDI
jgi:hypothetical protein